MSLIEDLRKAGEELPPSHVPTLGELAGVVGALVALQEHGDDFLKAAEAGPDEVAQLWSDGSPQSEQPQPVAAGPVAQPVPTPDPSPASPVVSKAPATDTSQDADLRAQLEQANARIAELERAQSSVTVTPAEPQPEPQPPVQPEPVDPAQPPVQEQHA